jgi:hypothetical protein
MLKQENLASPSLIPNILSTMKTYAEKKAHLKELALKSSKTAIARTIVDLDLNQQEESASSHVDDRSERGRRAIAVFGYHEASNGQGQPDKADDSVIVRFVPLTRKQGEGQASAGDLGEFENRRIFELGISIAGNYVRISPKNELDLKDMLTTSGLGLTKDDHISFFQFVKPGVHHVVFPLLCCNLWLADTKNAGTHCPSSKPIQEILSSSSHEDDRADAFTHVLLTFETNGSNGAHAEIADAGGRFLIDLDIVGSVRMEGMRYQPLAVEPTASVATSDDGKFTKRPFRRLTVLLPPNMSEYEKQLGRLSGELERGKGFSESAEIIAEVLSLVLIDQTNIDRSQYKEIITSNLKENPLLLYYASIELLDTVNPFFAQITAEVNTTITITMPESG